MYKISKFVVFVISGVVLLLMAGCSNSENKNTSVIEDSSAEQAVIPEHKHEQTEKPVYNPDAGCSIFIYMCGSNLESKNGLAGKDIDELLEADISDRVNVIVETGGAAKWHSHGIANDKLQRYIVKNHELTLVEELENVSMGDVNTFVDFLDWGRAKYPAERNLLVIWDHGGDATKGVCYDENYDFEGLKQSDFRYLLKHDEIVSAYENQKFDMVIFDTCLMGNIETAAWMQDYFHYMIASEVIVPGGGLDYRVIAGEFADNDDETFGKRVCDSFMEQCIAKGQEKVSELSLFDLSHTDAVLNELEIMLADNVNDVNNKDEGNVVEESEWGDARFYHMMADLYSTVENGTNYNSVDLYNSLSYLYYDIENWERTKKAIENLVLYHVGDVSVELFPDIDPDYYKNLCNGVSIYFPLKFDRTELKDYISFCPIENYAQLLDILYMHVPEVPLEFVNKGSLNEDGQIEIQLTENSEEYLKEVVGKVWKLRNRDNSYIMIGNITIDMSDIHDMTFTVPFSGEWYYLGGKRLLAEVVQKGEVKQLTAPIELNDEVMEYHVIYSYDNKGRPVFEKGIAGQQYDENGLIQRDEGFKPLKKGDTIEIVSNDIYEATEQFTLESDDLTVELQMLESGTYRVQLLAVDINNNYISSDYALYQVSEEGVKVLNVQKAE